ncbi:MAG: ribonuclease Z [Bacteroidales bacterium]|jgi:ribonuclease Z|nr:ribonuclease Z [Bacteroidales bacterium]
MALYLTILGSSSATPTLHRHPSALLLKSDKKKDYFLIDCGEGTQILMRQAGIRMQYISRIFISHLHGDHFFGLIGFIFTQNLLGRKKDLHIYAHKPLEKIIRMQLEVEKTILDYSLIFHPIDTRKKKKFLLYEDTTMEISSFPLLHSIPANGFLFKEKGRKKLISKEFIAQYSPTVKQITEIQKGSNFTDEKGNIIFNKDIIYFSDNHKLFAYCSDTAYTETILPYIEGVDLLFHEATFMEDLAHIATEKYHSTTKQAAKIAKLAQVKTLLIGHYSARYKDIDPMIEEAKTVFPNTLGAFEGSTLKI